MLSFEKFEQAMRTAISQVQANGGIVEVNLDEDHSSADRFYSVEVPARGGGWVNLMLTRDELIAQDYARHLTASRGYTVRVVLKKIR